PVVLQVLADAGKMMDDGDAERGQPLRIADAGALQDRRRTVGAAGQDDLAGGARLEGLPPMRVDDAARGLAVEGPAADHRAGDHGEVGAVLHRAQEGARGGIALAVADADDEIADAFGLAAIIVLGGRNALFDAGLAEGVDRLVADAGIVDRPVALGAVRLEILAMEG